MPESKKEEAAVMQVFKNDPAETERIEQQKRDTAKREAEIRERLKAAEDKERQPWTNE